MPLGPGCAMPSPSHESQVEMAAVAAAPLFVSVTTMANGFCRIGPLSDWSSSCGLMWSGMWGAPTEPMARSGTVGAAAGEMVPPQQPWASDKNVAGWPKTYPTDGSGDHDVAHTYNGALPGLSTSRYPVWDG